MIFLHWSLLKEHSKNKIEAISNFQTNILRTSSAFHSQKSVFLRRLLMLHIRRTWEGKKGKNPEPPTFFFHLKDVLLRCQGIDDVLHGEFES